MRKTSRSASRYCASSSLPGGLALAPLARDRQPDLDGPLEERRLGPALVGGALHHLGVDLLEDAGHGADEGGPERGQVLHQPLDAAVDGGGEADAQLRRADHLPEAVGQREPEELGGVLVIEDARLLDRGRLLHPAGVGQLHALGAAGGAGGVDERGQRVALHRRAGLLELAGVGLIAGPAQLLQRGEGDDEAVGGGGAVEDHDLAQRRELGPVAQQLPHLLLVLGEADHRGRVAQDVGALLGGGRRVDGGGGAAGAEDAEIGQHPLDAGAGEDGGHALTLQAEGAEPAGDGAHARLGAGPGELLPAAAVGVGEGERVRGTADAIEEQVPHGARLRPRQ